MQNHNGERQEHCTAWPKALFERSLQREKFPPCIQQILDDTFQKAGCGWQEKEAGLIAAQKIMAVWEAKLQPSLGRADIDELDQVALLIPAIRYLGPRIRGARKPWGSPETMVLLRDPDALRAWVPEESIDKIVQAAQGLSATSQGNEGYYKLQRAGLEKLEEMVVTQWRQAHPCQTTPIVPPATGEQPGIAEQETTSAPPPATQSQPLADCQDCNHSPSPGSAPRWPTLPRPYIERKQELDRLYTTIEAVWHNRFFLTTWFQGWVSICGLPQVGKTSLLAGLIERIQGDPAMAAQWDHIAFAAADVPLGAAPECVEKGQASLIGSLSAQLGLPLPIEKQTITQQIEALKAALQSRHVLIIVDNVASAQLLAPLKDLPPGVVGVLATRYPRVASEMAPEHQRFVLQGLHQEEAVEMARQITGLVGEWPAPGLVDLLDAVWGHPVAIQLLCETIRKLGHWFTLGRSFPEGLAASEPKVSRWPEAIAEEWEHLGQPLRRRLAVLGRIPLLDGYDDNVARALWGENEYDAHWTYEALAEAGLLESVGKRQYRLPWLVWLFAREQAHLLKGTDRRRIATWAWRYPLGQTYSEWRWWKGMLPRPFDEWERWERGWDELGNVQVPWWLFNCPSPTWRGHLLANAAECTALGRLRTVFWLVLVGSLARLVLSFAFFSWTSVAAEIVFAATILLAVENQWRLNWWRSKKRSFLEEGGKKAPRANRRQTSEIGGLDLWLMAQPSVSAGEPASPEIDRTAVEKETEVK